MIYRGILAKSEQLPQAEQHALLLWLVKHVCVEAARNLVRGESTPNVHPAQSELGQSLSAYQTISPFAFRADS